MSRLSLPPALRHRDFRVFWAGFAVSSFGTQFTTVAMAWHIYELTNSPIQIGFLGLARAVPQMVLLLFGGLLADRLDRRRLLIAMQVGQCGVSLFLAGMTVAGLVTPLTLYLASGGLALFSALELPARQSIVPNLVPREAVSSAISLNITQRDFGAIFGPAIAGLALALSGPALCYGVDAVSWLAMLVALVRLSGIGQARVAGGQNALQSLQEGFTFIWRNPVILCCMGLDFGATLFGTTRSLYPVFARDILQVGATGLGLLYAAVSVGAVVGALALTGMGLARRPGIWVLAGVFVFGISVVGFSLSRVMWLSLLMLAGTGAGNVFSAVLRNTINQLLTPDELRGRVSSVNSIFTMGGPQLGQFEAGAVAEIAGAGTAALSGGLATLVIAGALTVPPVIRRFELRPVAQPGSVAGR